MAIIDGKAPQPEDDRGWSPRVVVKLNSAPEYAFLPKFSARSAFTRKLHSAESDLVQTLRRVHPEGRLTRYLHEDEAISAGRRARFAPYLAITAPDAETATRLAREIAALDTVDTAYVEGGPTPPPVVNPADDPRSTSQGYLDAAPEGIDARWAWGLTDGHDVGFVDLEQGWTLDHEDLVAAGITVISGINTAYPGHGTAVLGEVVASDNTRGGIGIAPRANARVVSQYRTATNYSTAAAILSAVDSMSAGDVLLLEAQTTVGASSFLPVEVERAVFDAIVVATDAGITVIEAGGNGGNDLDAYTDAAGRHILDRSDPYFRDSGAIMVGAASSSIPHTRLGFSNYGSRIDCFGWGQGIDTTGDGWTGTSTTAYTGSFGGTSGASPIVAGAAILVQSWQRRVHGRVFDAWTLRTLLSGSNNTPSASPGTDRIGRMPDLHALIQALIDNDRFRPDVNQYLQWEYILFGLLNDAPGMIWVPGVGPVPVDPGWGDMSRADRLLFAEVLGRELESVGVAGVSVEAVADASFAALQRTLELSARRQ
ncbi:MAG: S8 family peptidase [Actinomycetota bacterium]